MSFKVTMTGYGPDESVSSFGQFVHDQVARTMDFMDDDMHEGCDDHGRWWVQRRLLDPPMVWMMEHKYDTPALSEAQKFFFELMERVFTAAIAQRLLHRDSGLWVVVSPAPHTSGTVYRYPDNTPHPLSGEAWLSFLRAEPEAPFLAVRRARRDAV